MIEIIVGFFFEKCMNGYIACHLDGDINYTLYKLSCFPLGFTYLINYFEEVC